MTEAIRIETRLTELCRARCKREKGNLFVYRDTDAWKAWRAWRHERGLPVAYMDTQEKYCVPMDYPPVDAESLFDEVHESSLAQKLGKA